MRKEIFEYEYGQYFRYSPNEIGDYPDVLFLHAKTHGQQSLSTLKQNIVPKQLDEGFEVNCNVIVPQLHVLYDAVHKPWDIKVSDAVMGLVKQPHIVGVSIGGRFVYSLLKYYPNDFKSAGIISGRDVEKDYETYAKKPMKIWHGIHDTFRNFTIQEARRVKDNVQALGGEIELKEYEAKHGIWNDAFDKNSESSYWQFLEKYI